MNTSLSIIILTCDQKSYTLRALAPLREMVTGRSDIEIVMVDNGSTDGTQDAVTEWIEACGIPGGTCRYIYLPSNTGVAAGRNHGIRAAKGAKLLLLDNDTIADAATIEAMAAYLDDHPECGLCAPALYSPDGELQSSAKPFPGLGVKLRHILCPGREPGSERNELQKPHPFYVIGACQMFRRAIVDRLGYLDEDIFYGPEDADWCMRITRAGYTIDYLPGLRIIHDWRRATRRSPFSRLALRHARGLVHFYIKHRRVW